MNEDFNGRITYEDLRQIIFDYFKKNQGIELGSTSIDYLKGKLMGNDDQRPFFIIRNEFGETRFDISKEDIQKVFSSYLSSKGCELSSIEYGSSVGFKYKQNSEIDLSKEEKVELDITYDGKMEYTALRQMIFDYYKENKGIQLGSISIDYLESKMTGGGLNNSQPFFIMKDEMGEKRFDITQEEMQEILTAYLAKKNYELTDLKFGSSVEFKYKQRKQPKKIVEQEITDLGVRINESEEIIRDGVAHASTHLVADDVLHFSPPKEETKQEMSQPAQSQPVQDDSLQQLARMEREKRKFTILQRERAMSDAQKAKNRSALLAGVCILGAAAAVNFNGQDISQVLQHELNAIYSWKALGQYLQDLGPMTTLLAAGAGGFIAKYFKNSIKFKKAQQEFIDFNASLEKNNTNELGGNENAKSR